MNKKRQIKEKLNQIFDKTLNEFDPNNPGPDPEDILDESEVPPEPWAKYRVDKRNREIRITLGGDWETISQVVREMRQHFSRKVHQLTGATDRRVYKTDSGRIYLEISTGIDDPEKVADEVKKFLKQQGFNLTRY